jgi:hypothetical protein
MHFDVEMVGRQVYDLRGNHTTAGTIVACDENKKKFRVQWGTHHTDKRKRCTWKAPVDLRLLGEGEVLTEFVSADQDGVNLKVLSDPYLYGDGSTEG